MPSAFFCDDDAVGVGKLTGTEELTFARIFYRVLLLRVPRCFASVLSLTFGQNNSGSCANRALFSSQLQNKPIRIFSTTWSGSLVPYCNKLLTFHRLQRQGVQTKNDATVFSRQQKPVPSTSSRDSATCTCSECTLCWVRTKKCDPIFRSNSRFQSRRASWDDDGMVVIDYYDVTCSEG